MFVLSCYLCIFLISASLAEDSSANNATETQKNETESTTEISIQRKIEFSADSDNVTKNGSERAFRPSPQLETVYEFNRDPVVPAVGEAKQVSNLNWGEQIPQPNSRSFWPLSDMFNKKPTATTEPPWVRRVVFPQTTAETTRDRPYPFVTASNFGSNFESRPPPRIPPTLSSYGSAPDNPRGYGYAPSKWDQYEPGGATKGPMIMHKTHYESYGPPEPTTSSVSTVSPIKKIIGLLAALVPIGLLLSALTPSVVQVVPMNAT